MARLAEMTQNDMLKMLKEHLSDFLARAITYFPNGDYPTFVIFRPLSDIHPELFCEMVLRLNSNPVLLEEVIADEEAAVGAVDLLATAEATWAVLLPHMNIMVAKARAQAGHTFPDAVLYLAAYIVAVKYHLGERECRAMSVIASLSNSLGCKIKYLRALEIDFLALIKFDISDQSDRISPYSPDDSEPYPKQPKQPREPREPKKPNIIFNVPPYQLKAEDVEPCRDISAFQALSVNVQTENTTLKLKFRQEARAALETIQLIRDACESYLKGTDQIYRRLLKKHEDFDINEEDELLFQKYQYFRDILDIVNCSQETSAIKLDQLRHKFETDEGSAVFESLAKDRSGSFVLILKSLFSWVASYFQRSTLTGRFVDSVQAIRQKSSVNTEEIPTPPKSPLLFSAKPLFSSPNSMVLAEGIKLLVSPPLR